MVGTLRSLIQSREHQLTMKHISKRSGLRTLGLCFAALLPLTIASATSTALGAWTTAAMTSIKFYKGAGSSTVLFNSNGRNFYEGAGSSKVLLNVSGTKAYEGAGSSKALFTVSGTKVFRAAGTSECLWNITSGKVYEGAGSSKALFNVSGTKLYRGAGTSEVVCNWSGGSLETSEIAAMVWLIEAP
jgi:hypothetical protein